MIILNIFVRLISWIACLCLRCTAWSASRLHQKIRSGPQARLWAASDDELLVEAQKRGLLKKKKKAKRSKNVVPLIAAACDEDLKDAIAAVVRLNNVSTQTAGAAVRRAVWEMQKNNRFSPKVQDIIQVAIKYA